MLRIVLFAGILFVAAQAVAQSDVRNDVLEKMIDFNRTMKTDRLLVSKRDSIIVNVTYRGKENELFNLYSITKVFSSIAIGILVDQRRIPHVEQPLGHYFPAWKFDSTKRYIPIRHILQHNSGLEVRKGSQDIYGHPDFVAYALSATRVDTPGFRYAYNNRSYNLASGVVQQVTGKTLQQFLDSALFQPMGITTYTWKQDKAGNTWGMDGLWMCASDLLKIGQLLQQGGTWRGKRYLSEAWCAMMAQLPLANIYQKTGGYGLGIRTLLYNEALAIELTTVEQLRRLGLAENLADKLQQLATITQAGFTYGELGQALRERFTLLELEQIAAVAYQHLIPIYQVRNKNAIVMHGGEYGLFLGYSQKNDVVLVRFLGEKWGRKKKEDGSDNKYLIDSELMSFMVQLIR